jgi:hypothetical protein
MVVDRRAGWVLAWMLVGCGDAGGSSTGGAGSETGATGSGATSAASTPTSQGSEPTGNESMTGSASVSASATGSASASTGASVSESASESASVGTSDTASTGSGLTSDASTGSVSTETEGTGTGSTDASTGMLSGSSGSSGSSGDPGCKSAADCPTPPGECVKATCVGGECGEGPEAAGLPCSLGACDGLGSCLECLSSADCPSKVCTAGVCAAASCGDGVKNGSESDVDCGGSCNGCELGESCGVPADCASKACTGGKCVAGGPACAQMAADPVTGQRCPLFMTCTASAECGDFVGCQQWFCNNTKTCELNAKVDCWTNKGGACNAEVVFTQHTLPPVDKRFVPPDNVNFREVASLAFTVKNNSASDLYLDKLPLQLEVMGGGSKFDVSSVKIFDNSGGTEHGLGDILVCLTADPFSFPANGVMGPCGGSAFSKVLKGQSNQFIVNVAFAKEKTFIDGRSYRLVMGSSAGVEFKVGFNGPVFGGSMCGVPNGGFIGAWVKAQKP